MTPSKPNDRLEELMRKYLAREQTPAETEELFDLMQSVHNPRILEEFFKARWNIEDRPKINMIWKDVLAARAARQPVSEKKKGRVLSVQPLWKWAVAASILAVISFLWWNQTSQPEFIIYTTDFGETKEIQLEDGSHITLNANSVLRWDKNWNTNRIRKAELQGEAFFEVAHVDLTIDSLSLSEGQSTRMPFQVESAGMVIEVLGTSFNVEERRGEARVYLKEGSVKLYFPGNERSDPDPTEDKSKSNPSASTKSVLMEVGETVQYSSRTREWVRLGADMASSITEWKDGILIFDDVRFGDMLQRMEDIYGKSFEVEDPRLLERLVNFEVPYENWETIEKLMSVTLQLEFDTSEEGGIIIKNRKE